MTDERQAFLAAINADPYDLDTRKIFADWLDENGTDADADLANEHRNWTREKQVAYEFMVSFSIELEMDPEELLATAKNYLLTGHGGYLGFDTPDRVYDDNDEFWRHYQVLTGEVVPEDQQRTFFSCAC